MNTTYTNQLTRIVTYLRLRYRRDDIVDFRIRDIVFNDLCHRKIENANKSEVCYSVRD